MCIYRKFKITFYPEYKKKPENKQISAGDFSIERMEAHERIYFENRDGKTGGKFITRLQYRSIDHRLAIFQRDTLSPFQPIFGSCRRLFLPQEL